MPYYCGPCLPNILSTESSPTTGTLPIQDSKINTSPASKPALFAFGKTGLRHLATSASKPVLLDLVETGSQHLANKPVAFGSVQHPCLPIRWDKRCLYNSYHTLAAKAIAHFYWAVYGFNSGHFISSIWSLCLPFNITISADPFVNGRSLFTEFSTTPSPILSGASALLHLVRSSGITVSYHRANKSFMGNTGFDRHAVTPYPITLHCHGLGAPRT